MRSRRCVVALVVPLMLVAACGDQDGESTGAAGDATSQESQEPTPEESPSASEPPADLDECAAVWKDGATLARDYAGCVEQGSAVDPDQQHCSFGKALVRYDDHYYAVRGGTIHQTAAALEKDRGYRSAMQSCTA
jgi:hypothetical protein